jgi:hypothetical protein
MLIIDVGIALSQAEREVRYKGMLEIHAVEVQKRFDIVFTDLPVRPSVRLV